MLQLSAHPKHDPNCCLGLSTRLFEVLKGILVQRVKEREGEKIIKLMSVGCGTGLFEAELSSYLRQQCLDVCIYGAETQSATTTFLSNDLVRRVSGTWDILEDIESAHVLIFVYPRDGRIVRKYLERFCDDITAAIWLGPRADWAEHEVILQDNTFFMQPQILEDAGLASYEIAVVFDKALRSTVKAAAT